MFFFQSSFHLLTKTPSNQSWFSNGKFCDTMHCTGGLILASPHSAVTMASEPKWKASKLVEVELANPQGFSILQWPWLRTDIGTLNWNTKIQLVHPVMINGNIADYHSLEGKVSKTYEGWGKEGGLTGLQAKRLPIRVPPPPKKLCHKCPPLYFRDTPPSSLSNHFKILTKIQQSGWTAILYLNE